MSYSFIGFPEVLSSGGFMSYLTLYFDESGKHHNASNVTFIGLLIRNNRLETFDEAWKTLLSQTKMNRLHMVDAVRENKPLSKNVGAQTLEARIETLKPFADCIREHCEFGLVQAMQVSGFNSYSKEALQHLGQPDSPHYLVFLSGLLGLLDHTSSDDRISCVCDDDQQTAWNCYRHYRGLTHTNILGKRIISLSFANDYYFPGLQACDFAALLTRFNANHIYSNGSEEFRYQPLWDYLVRDRLAGQIDWKYLFHDEAHCKDISDELSKVGRRRMR
jgi:hypothetical protein